MTTRETEPSTAIRGASQALLARRDEIGREIAGRVVEEIPGYRRVAPEVLDDLLSGATATVEVLARALADGGLRRADLAFVREVASRRVHHGVGLDDFLHAFRVALMTCWDACAEEASRLDLSREAGLALARSAIDAIDTITSQAGEGYLREEASVRTQSGRAARDIVERLIRGQPIDTGRRHPSAPGLNPTGQLVTIVARVEETDLPLGDALQRARDVLEETVSLGRAKPLVAIREGEVVLLAAGTSPRAKTPLLRKAHERTRADHGVDVRYGVSFPADGFPGVQRAYREAVLSLSYTSAARPIISMDELSSLECALVGADATTREVIASKGAGIKALAAGDLSVLTSTVRAFSGADLNVNRAAQRLHVHPNTIRYRLDRIATTTGHDPRTFTGLVELLCVLELLDDDRRG
jgi:hypothetical protein